MNEEPASHLTLTPTDGGVALAVKVVPGASRDQVVGPLGDALKIKVSAPPEGGKANKAVRRLLAEAVGVSRKDVTIVSGTSTSIKRVELRGIDTPACRLKLGLDD